MAVGETGAATYWELGLPRDRLRRSGSTAGDATFWEDGLPVHWMAVGVAPSSSARGGFLGAYDVTMRALRLTAGGTPSASRGTDLNSEQILRNVFDATQKKIRVVTVP